MSDEFEIQEHEPSRQEVEAALTNLRRRCDAAKIEFVDDSDLDADLSTLDLTLQIPCGRETRSVYLFDLDDINTLLSVEFEKYVLLENFSAICSYKDGVIEALVTLPSDSRSALRRTAAFNQLGIKVSPSGDIEPINLLNASGKGVQLSLCAPSPAAQILAQSFSSRGLSLAISGVSISNNEMAVSILTELSNSLFFSIDLQKGVHLSLTRQTQKRAKTKAIKNDLSLEFPRNTYDKESMALYWYARSATNMPLLQFLAYYQAIEFYYPAFSNAEVARRVRSIIKNPAFRPDQEADITKIVSTVRERGGNALSERDQLRITLKQCLENKDILSFLDAYPKRADFFLSKLRGITSCTINPQNKGMDLHVQVADRIYDIRCKIVHTKNDDRDSDNIEFLLPYSSEAEKLDEDIELVRLVAQKVLICASKDMAN